MAEPTITAEPRTQFAWEGRRVVLSVTANGTGLLSYRWQLNEADYEGGTNRTLLMPRVQRTNDGAYQVLVSDSTGVTTTSKVARLMVRARPEPTGPRIPQLASLDSAMQTVLTNHGIPGGSLAVVKDGRLVFARGYGWASVEDNERFQPDSLSRIASLSKTIAAATIMKLVEAGKLSLDDRAFNLLNYERPNYAGAVYDARLTNITVRHLLNHRAGWNRDTATNPLGGRGFDPPFWPTWIANDLGLIGIPYTKDVVRWILGKPLQANPGSQFSYSNIGYVVAGTVIGETTQKSFETAARELLAQTGITRIQVGRETRQERVRGEAVYYTHPTITAEFWAPLGDEPKPVDINLAYADPMRSFDSAGGLVGSAIEFARFVAAIDGLPSYPDILDTNSVRTMATGLLGWDSVDTPTPATGIWWKDGASAGSSSLAVKWRNGIVYVFVFNSFVPGVSGTTGAVTDLFNRLNNALANLTWPTNDLFSATLSYDAWRTKAFSVVDLSDPAVSGDDADPDEDGVPNLLEYAHGGNPRAMNEERTLSITRGAGDQSGSVSVNFPRLLVAHELDYNLEFSADLRTWSSLDGETEGMGVNGHGAVTASYRLASAENAARFLRLRVSRNN